MNNSEREIYLTTPEKKRAYIHQWLLSNPHRPANFDTNINEQTPPSSPKPQEKCIDLLTQQPSVSSCTITKSPILGGKRLASSPIIGGRRRFNKRIKVAKKLDTIYTKGNTSSESKSEIVLKSKTHTEVQDNINENIFDNNITLVSTVKIEESDLDLTFDDSKSAKQNDIKTKKIFQMVRKTLDDTASQLIESASSTQDTSIGKTEQDIQEASSDTDKTISDLIEDVSTQIVLIKAGKCNEIPISQKISNPSSTSSKSEIDIHISEITSADTSKNVHLSDTGTLTDQIDTVRTLDSKTNFGKTSYILQHTTETSKRKKTYQKGGLLDILLTVMAKEKSSVNLLRHQVCRKIIHTNYEKPFILLQIVEHLPKTNDFQLLKCILIEDSTDLLSDFLIENRLISVINVPEISCLINTNEKPVLKVYEPWTIIDPNQLILHITRFIAVPSNSKNWNLVNENLIKKDLKTIREFHCPCIDQNRLSNECKMKFCDCSYNVVRTIFSSMYQ